MLKNVFYSIFFYLFSVHLVYSQSVDSSLFTTDKKPLLDPAAKKGGILGGRISTSGVPDVKETKEKAEKFKSETLPDLGLKIKKAKAVAKEVLKNKNEYEGLKMAQKSP